MRDEGPKSVEKGRKKAACKASGWVERGEAAGCQLDETGSRRFRLGLSRSDAGRLHIGLALGRNVMMVLGTGFVSGDLSVEFVGQFIYSGIEVGM